jgi:hypothetical protein
MAGLADHPLVRVRSGADASASRSADGRFAPASRTNDIFQQVGSSNGGNTNQSSLRDICTCYGLLVGSRASRGILASILRR